MLRTCWEEGEGESEREREREKEGRERRGDEWKDKTKEEVRN